MKIVQISDTHIAKEGGVTADNLARLIDLIEGLAPDLVVHSGDAVILDPDDDGDRFAARDAVARISAPVRVVPGNHDVGEAAAHPWAGIGVTSERVAAFVDVFGPDYWVEITDGPAVVGIDTEILGSGLPEEDAQWDWLAEVPGLVGDRPTMVVGHKPLWNPFPVETEHNIAVPAGARDRLLELLAEVDVRVWASGHLHHYGVAAASGGSEGALAVSAPATGFAHGSLTMGIPGISQIGVVEYRIDGREFTPYFRSLPTLAEVPPMKIPEFAVALDRLGVTL